MIVLGPSGVGKTSLLATMYKEFAKLESSFGFLPVGDVQNRLDDAYHKLARAKTHERFEFVGGLLPGSQTFSEYPFDVTLNGKPQFGICFHDYRGGAMAKVSDGEYAPLLERISRCRVIFIVVDAVALMEADAVRCDELNAHTTVATVLQRALKPDEKRLIVFVLIKCESYLKTETRKRELIGRFQDRHRAVLNVIGALNKGDHNIVGVTIPVNTLGCVEYQETDAEGNFIFVRTHREFAPKDVDQPLRFALAFALKELDGDRGWFRKIWRKVQGEKALFQQALSEFGRKRRAGYPVYGNGELLRMPA